MIYYFSGTGNSKWIAEQIAQRTKDSAASIPEIMKTLEQDITVPDNEVVGIVFPVYGWAPPAAVTEFLEHVHVSPKAFTFAVCTCGGDAGKTMQDLFRVFQFKSAYSITMPNNYIRLFDMDSPELVREKTGIALQRLPRIAADITARRSVHDVHEGSLASLKTNFINPVFQALMMHSSCFSADNSCTGCGICVQSCPFGTIRLSGSRPVWKGRCQQCMSCISRCPVQAIQCGQATRGRGRYVFAENSGSAAVTAAADHTHTDIPGTRVIMPDSEPEEEMDIKHTAVPAEGGMELIKAADIKTLANPRVLSRQLIWPENSASTRITMTEVHLRPGASQPRHSHPAAEQIWYALKGKGFLLLADNTEKPFEAGDVVRFAEGEIHGLLNDGSEEFVYISVTSPPVNFSHSYKGNS